MAVNDNVQDRETPETTPRGPRTSARMRGEWSLVCIVIQRNSGFTPPQAERFFEVGNGSGRAWRYWTEGARLARVYVRRAVIERAKTAGFVTAADLALIRKSTAGVTAAALPLLDVPAAPEGFGVTAEEAAIYLFFSMYRARPPRSWVRLLTLAGRGFAEKYLDRASALRSEIERAGVSDEVAALTWLKASYATRS